MQRVTRASVRVDGELKGEIAAGLLVLVGATHGDDSDAAQWLARKELLCRTVTIKVRYSDFTTVTRSHSAPATRDPEDLAQRAVALLDKTEAGRRPVRLLGASVHNLIDPDTPTEEPMLPFEEEA